MVVSWRPKDVINFNIKFNINRNDNKHNEIRQRINAKNRKYFATNKMFNSRMLSWKTKEKLYTSYLGSIAYIPVKRDQPLK